MSVLGRVAVGLSVTRPAGPGGRVTGPALRRGPVPAYSRGAEAARAIRSADRALRARSRPRDHGLRIRAARGARGMSSVCHEPIACLAVVAEAMRDVAEGDPAGDGGLIARLPRSRPCRLRACEPDRGGLAGWVSRLAPSGDLLRSAPRGERRGDVARMARPTGRQRAGRRARRRRRAGAFAHLGVLEVLLDAGMPVDRVGGVSMGAFIGGLPRRRPRQRRDRCLLLRGVGAAQPDQTTTRFPAPR